MLLIIEDTMRHQAAARIQLPEARVVNYDEAYRILEKARPGELSAILTDLHFKVERAKGLGGAAFAPCYPKNMEAIGKEMPFGLAFVLKAVELQTPTVLYSDIDHHSDLITGFLDMLGRGGRYPWRKDREEDPIPDPRFALLRDGGCIMAKDMYWDGEKIVCEQLPSYGDGSGKAWDEYREKMKGKELVKDWRVAFRALTTLGH